MTTTTTKATRKPAAKKATPKAKAAPRGSWAQRNPEAVALIPERIKAGQHPRQFAEEQAISLEVAWANFKKAGWKASGKGGGKAITLTPAEAKAARDALAKLQAIAKAKGVSAAGILRAAEREATT